MPSRLLDMAHSKRRASEVQYDVFLSFNGADTRSDFTVFLNRALNNAGIRVFMDEDAIKVGDKIGETILQAIDNSEIYIPIISQTYLDCKWCLIELERMMNNVSQSEARKKIFPIFYKVRPGMLSIGLHAQRIFPLKSNLGRSKRLLQRLVKSRDGRSRSDEVAREFVMGFGVIQSVITKLQCSMDDLEFVYIFSVPDSPYYEC
ncbi:TMV resistance protein N-like [Eucalyptus grandis]|uniref:TMV resistance protein N-like n=1 Tax=Eucalyptus grandis TaxID=71139 RepID=UPI00192ED7EA|nr:TMV resistance protein N-like [Eucalyptus grandis]